jgi:hypothetical protein
VLKFRKVNWVCYVICLGEQRNTCSVVVKKPEGKRPLGRPRRISKDNIKMDLKAVGWIGID